MFYIAKKQHTTPTTHKYPSDKSSGRVTYSPKHTYFTTGVDSVFGWAIAAVCCKNCNNNTWFSRYIFTFFIKNQKWKLSNKFSWLYFLVPYINYSISFCEWSFFFFLFIYNLRVFSSSLSKDTRDKGFLLLLENAQLYIVFISYLAQGDTRIRISRRRGVGREMLRPQVSIVLTRTPRVWAAVQCQRSQQYELCVFANITK